MVIQRVPIILDCLLPKKTVVHPTSTIILGYFGYQIVGSSNIHYFIQKKTAIKGVLWSRSHASNWSPEAFTVVLTSRTEGKCSGCPSLAVIWKKKRSMISSETLSSLHVQRFSNSCMLERQSLLFSHKLFFVLPLESRRRAAQQPRKPRWDSLRKSREITFAPVRRWTPALPAVIKSSQKVETMSWKPDFFGRKGILSIQSFTPVSGQTLVLGLSKIITMRSLNAGKSSRLVVKVEPCLGTQHLHVLAKFPASFHGEKWLWKCEVAYSNLQATSQFISLLEMASHATCSDNLYICSKTSFRTLAEPHFATDYNWGCLSWLPLKCFPNFRVTITCQPPESAWCFKDRVT